MSNSFAVTRPVNPPGAEPVLTEAQLWKGLEYKARNAHAFIPGIVESKTIVDDGKKVENELKTADGRVVKDRIEVHAPTILYIESDIGPRGTNIVSYEAAWELLLALSTANGIPGIVPDAPKPSVEDLNARFGGAIEKNLSIIRDLLKAGKL
ncbi:DUF1857-domain-containing protein [Mycena alexandri]|uniref:DUF1857-domain-containing protein n=1 Tax=Mycena alexandri TaxID=1745969 RepID=A0AAD6SG75_9AGAR|nr:DUF1857-domain-containing protein [Mycena alexandri]